MSQQTNKQTRRFYFLPSMVSARQSPKQCLYQTHTNFDTKNSKDNDWRRCTSQCCVCLLERLYYLASEGEELGSNEVRSSLKQRTRQRRNLSKFLGGPAITLSVWPALSWAATLRAAESSPLLTALSVRGSEPPLKGRPEVNGTSRTHWYRRNVSCWCVKPLTMRLFKK